MPAKSAKLLADPGIVRNRLKIAAAIQNAKAFLAVQKEFGSFDAYVWRFVEGRPIRNAWKTLKQIPARTPEAEAMSKDLLRTRLQIRRPDHLLRLHAGRGHGERPPGQLLPQFGTRPSRQCPSSS